MNHFRRFSIFIALLCVLLVAVGGAIPLARAVIQELVSSEEVEVTTYGRPATAVLIGDDPDEDGYTGVIPTQSDTRTEASEGDLAAQTEAGPVDWSLYLQGPQPDEERFGATSESITTITDWSDFRYVRVAGATLVPRDSTTSWDYSGAGCISASSGNDNFTIHLPIPNGSRIDYLRLYYYDTSANNSTAWVTTYDGAGGINDLTSVSSTGSSGYGTTLSPYVGHVVDSMSNSYVLNWRANQTGSTMRLCGLRVAYRDPQ